jgi:Fur family transcriptional regulator, ferric uptake regulator
MDDTISPKPSAPEPRLAANYRLVYDLLQESGQGRHLSMPEVHALTRSRQPAIGFTTVYRALVRLRDMGLVSEIHVPGAENAYYEVAAHPHAHFRCITCGTIQDVDYRLPQGVVDDIASSHGIEVGDVLLSLHGQCAVCRTPALSA